ncbi:MAG: DUF4349 domain-containing protein [Chloroflexi bacterium]|nr:DUF4349 domain-containing protein [Chloroflexota bacterium]
MNPRFILLPIALAFSLCACGNTGLTVPASSAPKAAGGDVSTSGPTSAQAPQPAVAAGQAPAGTARTAAAPPAQLQAQGAAGLPSIPVVERMIVKNGSLTINVDDPETSLSQVDQLVQSQQGVIAAQSVRNDRDTSSITLTIQVPPENFETTLAKLRDLRAHGMKPQLDTVNSQDVTEQFVDLDAQYRNLQATRDAYQKLLDKASAVSDVITLTREIASIQTQMDQIQGRKNLISRQAAVSTINLTLLPAGASASPSPKPLPGPEQAATQAWNVLRTAGQGLEVALIWMAILLPLPALLLAAGWFGVRRVSRPRLAQAESNSN